MNVVGIMEAGRGGLPDTSRDGRFVTVKYSFTTTDLDAIALGEKVIVQLKQSKSSQAHFHFLHIEVEDI